MNFTIKENDHSLLAGKIFVDEPVIGIVIEQKGTLDSFENDIEDIEKIFFVNRENEEELVFSKSSPGNITFDKNILEIDFDSEKNIKSVTLERNPNKKFLNTKIFLKNSRNKKYLIYESNVSETIPSDGFVTKKGNELSSANLMEQHGRFMLKTGKTIEEGFEDFLGKPIFFKDNLEKIKRFSDRNEEQTELPENMTFAFGNFSNLDKIDITTDNKFIVIEDSDNSESILSLNNLEILGIKNPTEVSFSGTPGEGFSIELLKNDMQLEKLSGNSPIAISDADYTAVAIKLENPSGIENLKIKNSKTESLVSASSGLNPIFESSFLLQFSPGSFSCNFIQEE